MTNGIGLYEITDNIATTVGELKFNNALINLSIPHTSCSLLIQENASPAVQNDLISFYKKMHQWTKTFTNMISRALMICPHI